MQNMPPVQNQAQPTNNSPVTQTSTQPSLKKKTPWLLISIIVLLLSATGVLGYKYYELQQRVDKLQLSTPQPSPQLVANSPLPKQSPILVANQIPDDWSYQTNGECGVKFPIPPKIKPYFHSQDSSSQPSVTSEEGSGRFWDFPRGGVYPNMLSKVAKYELVKQANAMYATAGEASGYVSAAVSVSCVKNTTNLNNQIILQLLEENIQKYNLQDNSERMEASSYTISSSNTINKWSQLVIDLKASEYYQNPGGKPYTKQTESIIFATPTYLYEIKVVGQTEDSFVMNTANQIFDNLKFNKT